MRNLLIFVFLVVLAMSISCDRHIESKDPAGSYPATGPIPVNVRAYSNDASITLNWEVSDGSAVPLFRIYATTGDGDFTLIDSTSALEIDLDDLLTNRTYAFQVAAVQDNGIEGLRSETVMASVVRLSLQINDGADKTGSRSVVIGLNAPGTTTHIQISEDSTFADAVWESFSPQTLFTLSDGDGAKRVYARFQFSDGTRSIVPVSDDITLDTQLVLTAEGLSSFQIALRWTRSEISDFDAYRVYRSEWSTVNSGSDLVTTYTNPAAISYTDTALEPATLYYYRVVVMTDTGQYATSNVADAATEANEAPAAPELFLVVESNGDYTLTWTASTEADFGEYRIFRSQDDISSDEAAAEVSADLLTIITNRYGTSYSGTLVDGATYKFRVFSRDRHGLSTASNQVSGSTL